MSETKDVIDRIAPYIRDAKNGKELMRIIRAFARSMRAESGDEACAFDIAEAVYHFSSSWYAGQSDPLYSAACATDFSPGTLWRAPETGSAAAMLSDELSAAYGPRD